VTTSAELKSPEQRRGGTLAIAGFAVAVLALAMMALRKEIFAREPVLIAVQAVAVALLVWARVTFGRRSFNVGAQPTAGELVTTGPYRFWRHPIYAAVIIFVIAAALNYRTLSAAVLAVVASGGMFVRMRAEERFLAERYSDYAAYAARTARVIPGIF
jgi:protein-S-isoprenylcysteine O-methyltransferase Ste14